MSLTPTALDRNRLYELAVDGRMESESGHWIVCRYPKIPAKGIHWCEYSLVLNHPQLKPIPHTLEFRTLDGLIRWLYFNEASRRNQLK